MILVTGATGSVGRELTAQLAELGEEVRALSRSPHRIEFPNGVEPIVGDLGVADTLLAAVKGVDRVFLLSTGADGPTHDANVTAAAQRAGVRHIVKLSVFSAGNTGAVDPISGWHREGERIVRASGLAWTFLRPLGFMANALKWADTVVSEHTVYAPFGEGRTAIVDPADVAAVAAKVLTQSGHERTAYSLTGLEALSPGDQVAAIAREIGRPIRYVDIPPAAARAAMVEGGMPDELAGAVLALLSTSLDPSSAVVLPDIELVTGRPARSFTAWVRAHRGVFIGESLRAERGR